MKFNLKLYWCSFLWSLSLFFFFPFYFFLLYFWCSIKILLRNSWTRNLERSYQYYFLWKDVLKIMHEKGVELKHSAQLFIEFRNIPNSFCLWSCLPVSVIHTDWLVPFSQTQMKSMVFGSLASFSYACPPKEMHDLCNNLLDRQKKDSFFINRGIFILTFSFSLKFISFYSFMTSL